eukprot:380834-Hanusia_phi.AAC.1
MTRLERREGERGRSKCSRRHKLRHVAAATPCSDPTQLRRASNPPRYREMWRGGTGLDPDAVPPLHAGR